VQAMMVPMTTTTSATTTTETTPTTTELSPGGAAVPRRRGRLSSIRYRLLSAYVGLLALTLLSSVVAVRTVLLQRLDDRIDAELAQEAEELRTLARGRDPVTGEPFGERVDRILEVFLSRNIPGANETMLSFVDGEPFLRSARQPPLRLDQDGELMARWAAVSRPTRGSVDTEAGEVDYLAVPLTADGEVRGVFVVAIFSDLERRPTDEVVRIAGITGLLSLAVGSLLALSLAGRILAPVAALTRTARGITDTDLSRRIDVRGSDELSHLAVVFNQMLDRLERAIAGQRDFLDDAGHELRTPITIVRGHLELMGDDPGEREEVVALVLDELDRMTRMVDDMLLLAKAQRPDFLRLETVDVEALTTEVFGKAHALAAKDWRLEAVGRGRIVADRQRLTQALVQLAANAAAYTDDGTLVAIGSVVQDGTVRLWVRDEGPGVPHEEQAQLFDRFARGSRGQRSADGSGLGLAIVRAIAEAHGGRVELDSRPGAGATFTVVVPTDPDEEGTPTWGGS
jgi:two-component system, OmpR family, sensor kinase